MENLGIKVIGLGEGGARIINKILAAGTYHSTEFISVGNDENIMLTSTTRKNIFLNRDLTTLYKNFSDTLRGAKLIFLVGGLASNAARVAVPIITSRAKNIGAVIVALFCRPSVLESFLRKNNAEYTLNNLRGQVDTLIVVPAEKFLLFCMRQQKISMEELFDVADDIFCRGVKIFLEMFTEVDSSLALFKWGNAMFGYGAATTALDAIKVAVKFPLFEEDDLKDTPIIFVRLVSGKSLQYNSIEAVESFIRKQLPPDAKYFSQEDTNPALGDKIVASIILTRKQLDVKDTRIDLLRLI